MTCAPLFARYSCFWTAPLTVVFTLMVWKTLTKSDHSGNSTRLVKDGRKPFLLPKLQTMLDSKSSLARFFTTGLHFPLKIKGNRKSLPFQLIKKKSEQEGILCRQPRERAEMRWMASISWKMYQRRSQPELGATLSLCQQPIAWLSLAHHALYTWSHSWHVHAGWLNLWVTLCLCLFEAWSFEWRAFWTGTVFLTLSENKTRCVAWGGKWEKHLFILLLLVLCCWPLAAGLLWSWE